MSKKSPPLFASLRLPKKTPLPLEFKDYLQYLGSPKRIFWMNFLAGTARGLGFILGTVVFLALLTFVVSQVLSQIPWIGELFRWLDDWLRENLSTYQPV